MVVSTRSRTGKGQNLLDSNSLATKQKQKQKRVKISGPKKCDSRHERSGSESGSVGVSGNDNDNDNVGDVIDIPETNSNDIITPELHQTEKLNCNNMWECVLYLACVIPLFLFAVSNIA